METFSYNIPRGRKKKPRKGSKGAKILVGISLVFISSIIPSSSLVDLLPTSNYQDEFESSSADEKIEKGIVLERRRPKPIPEYDAGVDQQHLEVQATDEQQDAVMVQTRKPKHIPEYDAGIYQQDFEIPYSTT